VEIINLLLMSVALVIGPRIARQVAARNPRSTQAVCNLAIIIQGVPAAFACAVVLLIAPRLLGLFDPSFVQYSGVLQILAIGVLINALAGPTVLMLQLADLHWRQVALQGGSLTLALAALPLLTSYYGLVGAAVAWVVSKVLWNLAAIIACRSRLGVDPSILGLVGFGALGMRESARDLRNRLSGMRNV
jgi:O-antigen/teichoic acid export membrane protein